MGRQQSFIIQLSLIVGVVLLVGIVAMLQASETGDTWSEQSGENTIGLTGANTGACPLQASLYNGMTQQYEVDGDTYTIKAVLQGQSVVLTVNGESTPTLRVGESATLPSGAHVKIKSIMNTWRGKRVTFCFTPAADNPPPTDDSCAPGQQSLRYNAGAGALTWTPAGAYSPEGTSSLWTSGEPGRCCDQGTHCAFPGSCWAAGSFMGNYSYVCATDQNQGVIFGCTDVAADRDGQKLLGNAAYCCSKYSADYNQGNAHFHALPGQRRFGPATLDEKREITRPDYDACTDGSDNDCDGLVDAQDPDCGGTDSEVRGVFFNPPVTLDGQWLGTKITEHYFEGNVREQFRSELRKFKQKTGGNAVLLWAWPHMGMSWPLAESYQLDGLAAMIEDANAEGLEVILGIGHPYIVPKSRMIEEGTDGVCGHHAGDVVGGLTLLWDMAPCTEDVITPSKAWFSSVIDGLEARGITKDDVSYLMVGGHYKLFYGGEFNMLRGANVHLPDAKEYLRAMNPYLHSITDIPVGISLLPKTLRPGTSGPEDFLHNLLDAVPIEQWDVLDITWSPYVDPAEIDGFQAIVDTVPEKIIVSDFKTDIAHENGMDRAAAITNGIDYAQENGLKGYWLFVYSDMGGSYGLVDAQGNWREDLVQAFSRGQGSDCDGTASDADCQPQEDLRRMPVACVPGEQPALVTQEFLGMGMKEAGPWLNTLTNTTYLEWMTQRLDDAGVRSTITGVGWSSSETQNNTFTWYNDPVIANLTRVGIRPIAALTNTPTWASSNPNSDKASAYPPRNMDDWKDAVRQAVRHYGPAGKNQVKDWKIWNEPNGLEYWRGTREEFTALLNAGYDTIKQEDPTAKVWAPGIVYHENNKGSTGYNNPDAWVDHIIAHGKFDVLTIHMYYRDPVEMRDTIRRVRQKLDAAGKQGTPIAVTEFNIFDLNGPNCPYWNLTEAQQAQNLRRSYACVADGGAASAYWFTATDRPSNNPAVTCPGGWIRSGVFTRTPVATKLSYNALREIGVALGTATVETPPPAPQPSTGTLTADPNPCVISADSKRCSTTISWSSSDVQAPYVQVLIDDVRFACAQANVPGQKTAFIEEATRVFVLYPANSCESREGLGDAIAKLDVRGVRLGTDTSQKSAFTTTVARAAVEEKG